MRYLGRNSITAQGARNLMEADWKNLVRLEIGGNRLGADGVAYLTKCNWPKLKSLILDNNQI